MQSKAATVDEYLASLPADRRAVISAVRDVIRANLDADFEEGMQYGMIGYYVPHRVFPAGYHCNPTQPLPFAALGSQKQSMSLHLMCVYIGGDGSSASPIAQWFRDAWIATGRKLDMGKACVRFKKLDDVALDVLGELIRRVPAKTYIARYAEALGASKSGSRRPAARAKPANAKARAAAKKPAARKPAAKAGAGKKAR